MEKFEDINIEGIGNLKNFQDKTVAEIRAILPKDKFTLFVANESIPTGWPGRIMETKKGQIERNNKIVTVDFNEWYMCRDGIKWENFYGFVLTVYLEELKLMPAFIYERKIIREHMVYIPIVSMLFSLEKKTTAASKSWCDAVLRAREK